MKTIVEKAKATITGFNSLCHKFERDIIINGKAKTTFKSYILQIANISLYFNKTPIELTDDQIADYLFKIKKEHDFSESYFKFSVYGLRYLFRLYGLEKIKVMLP